MGKATKIWLIIAVCLIAVGVVIAAGNMTAIKWDFKKLASGRYETNTYEITEEFDKLSIDVSTADVVVLPSEDGKSRVVCYEMKNIKHTASVEDGELSIIENDTRKWYEHIGFYFENQIITVYLPKAEYTSLKHRGSTGNVEISTGFAFGEIDVNTSTGDVRCSASAIGVAKIAATTGRVRVENATLLSLDVGVTTGRVIISGVSCAGNLRLTVSTGEADISGVRCENLTTSGSTGDVSLEDVIVTQKLTIDRSTGDVELEDCDAGEIYIETDTGDVDGNLLSEKTFIVDSDTGEIEVPRGTTGGRCEITTDTGDIEISIR